MIIERAQSPDVKLLRLRDLAQLSLLYFPLTMFWTAALTQLLPARVEVLAGAQKGLALAIVGSGGALAATLCIVLVGPLSDATAHKRGRRYPWIVRGVLLGALGALGFALAPNLIWLLCAFVVARLGLACTMAGYESLLPDRVNPSQHARASAWGEFWDLCGQTGGIAITGLLAVGAFNSLVGKHWIPAVETRNAEIFICSVCAVLLLVVLAFNRRWIEQPSSLEMPHKPWREVLASAFDFKHHAAPDFYRLYLSRCVLNAGTYTGIEFLRYFMGERFPTHDLSHEVMIIGLLVTGGGVIGAFLGGAWGDIVSKRGLLYTFGMLAAIAAIGFSLSPNLATARVCALVWGIGFSAINAIDWAFATTLVPRGQEARFLAVFQTCFTLPQIWVLSFGGWLGSTLGYRALFWTIPFYIFGGLFLLQRVRESHEIAAAAPETSLA